MMNDILQAIPPEEYGQDLVITIPWAERMILAAQCEQIQRNFERIFKIKEGATKNDR